MAKIQVTDNTKCWSEAVEQQEFSFTDGGNENWYSHYERQSDTFWQNTLLPYDPVIKILSIYPELKTYVHTKKVHMDVYSSILILAKTWNQDVLE